MSGAPADTRHPGSNGTSLSSPGFAAVLPATMFHGRNTRGSSGSVSVELDVARRWLTFADAGDCRRSVQQYRL